jgi:hypothetical protein
MHLSEWFNSYSDKPNAGKDAKKLDHSNTVGANVK